ncbi:MAG: alanine/glycine:cation symporter family protein [Candidatus Dadabacteria bacterium]|nr:alanine/glycine:cation symporter family protein [Candidatus Dadabacteria bacterium]
MLLPVFLFPALFIVFALSAPQSAHAGIESSIESVAAPVADFMLKWVFYSVPLFGTQVKVVVMLLVGAGVFCTLYFRFINIRGFGRAIDLVAGRRDSAGDAPGEVSHFQALATACGATVGLGNIAGVAIAVSKGGPGATFWMIVAGLLGMSLKFCECTLGVKYRKENPDGSVSGGPMYYLSRGLGEMGLGGLGRVLSVMFAVFCIGGAIGAGGIFQANQSFKQIQGIAEAGGGQVSGALFGVALAVALGFVIIGGIKKIATVTARVVPFMAIIYVLSAGAVIALQFDKLPEAFSLIVRGAFSPEGVEGGMLGVMVWGFQRATFSNEAGLGSAPIAHSAVKTRHPATEGIVALLEPFLDTVVICTMTSLVIVLTGAYRIPEGMGGIEITSAAFASSLEWFPYLLALCALLFAFSTMISWSYYGLKSWTFLFGETPRQKLAFNFIFCLFVAAGAAASLSSVINITDSMIFLMAAVNLTGVFLLAPVVKRELRSYMNSRDGK